jgi:predicted RNA-binding protein YlqC (UPF0109 family)
MKDLLLVITRNLVEHPEDVFISEESHDNTIVLKLKVAAEDMGRVIGKQGRIAKAIRTVVKAAAINGEKKVIVEIVN